MKIGKLKEGGVINFRVFLFYLSLGYGTYFTLKFPLRIPDSYHAKTLKKNTPPVHFSLYFHNQAISQKSERSFVDQVAIDDKSALTIEDHPLVEELKSKT